MDSDIFLLQKKKWSSIILIELLDGIIHAIKIRWAYQQHALISWLNIFKQRHDNAGPAAMEGPITCGGEDLSYLLVEWCSRSIVGVLVIAPLAKLSMYAIVCLILCDCDRWSFAGHCFLLAFLYIYNSGHLAS